MVQGVTASRGPVIVGGQTITFSSCLLQVPCEVYGMT